MSLNDLFASTFADSTTTSIGPGQFFLCLVSALVMGLFIAWLYTYRTKCSKSFVVTLTVLPAVVTMVILMVNGNLGAGVAVAGAFSLVRFRSVPGTAKEIGALFLAMSTGLAVGMGYIAYAVLFVLLISLVNVILTASTFGDEKSAQRTMTITIPEDLDYTGVFDDLFVTFTKTSTLNRVKTTNMGSLLKLTYDIELVDEKLEKRFLDEIRCRNGNLEIVMAKPSTMGPEL